MTHSDSVVNDFPSGAWNTNMRDGDNVAESSSWLIDGDSTANDWLVSPQITLTTDNTLSWSALAPDSVFSDGYQVFISSTGDMPADFTELLFEIDAEESVTTNRQVSLSDYSGQTVRFAWRNNSKDLFRLVLDDIRVDDPASTPTTFSINDVTGCSDGFYEFGETEDYTIKIVEPSLPDLAPQLLSIDTTTIGAGAAVNVEVRVLNQSSIDAAASTLAYFLSLDNVLDNNDVFLGEVPIAAIPGFESDDFQGSSLIPGSTTPGSYFLVYEADALDEVNESNEDNNEIFVGITVVELGDTVAPSISFADRPRGYVPGTGGFTITVQATDDDSGIDQVGYFLKKITDPGGGDLADFTFGVADQSASDETIYEATFSDDDFGTLGIEYLFVATDGAGNVGLTNLIPRTTTIAFAANSQTLAGLSAGSQAADYELISFPLVFDSPSPTSVFDELGTYDRELWRMFHWNSNNQSYQEHPSFGSFQAGAGYWLIFANQVTLQVGNSRLVDATLTQPFTITLRNGWNQIGNPYLGNISWSDVLDHNITARVISSGDVQNPNVYDGGFSEVADIDPFEGAFVEANGTFELQIPLQATGVGGRRGPRIVAPWNTPLDASSWEVRFNLQASNYAYGLGGIGMHQQADIGKDPFDRSTLPRLDEYLELNFAHPEHIIPFFTRDVVPKAENHTWEFTVESGLKDKKLTLSWENDFFGVNGKHLVLFDVDRQKTIDMREVSSYEFGISGVKKFKALYGSLEYIENELQPNRLSLGNAYPNPFNQQIIIPYSMPPSDEDYRVNVSVYNSLGQKVITLVDQEQTGGFHEAQWNGRSGKGSRAGPGIYIYQLNVSGVVDNPVLNGKLIMK